jgi:hypothetical protein
MATEKNFSMEVIQRTFDHPTRVYPSGSHPGQWRVTGNGICLVGIPDVDNRNDKQKDTGNTRNTGNDGEQQSTIKMITIDGMTIPIPIPDQPVTKPRVEKFFTVITLYQDMELSPPREDQLNTMEGRRFAERYFKGLGRG